MPTLLFGIPGSGAMAVFLGGMVLLGIEAGPAMVSSDLDLTYTIVWSLALANVLGAGLCIVLARPIARLTTLPFNYLAPFMIVAISFAAFQATRDLMDLAALLGIGAIGVVLKRFAWSRPAFLIGFVLAPQAEGYLNLATQFYGWQMLLRPGVLIILAITVVSVFLGARQVRRGPATIAADGAASGDGTVRGTGAPVDPRPQLLFVALTAAIVVYAVASSLQRSPLAWMFPVIIGIATLLACLAIGGLLAFGPRGDKLNFDAEQTSGDCGKEYDFGPVHMDRRVHRGDRARRFRDRVGALARAVSETQGRGWHRQGLAACGRCIARIPGRREPARRRTAARLGAGLVGIGAVIPVWQPLSAESGQAVKPAWSGFGTIGMPIAERP